MPSNPTNSRIACPGCGKVREILTYGAASIAAAKARKCIPCANGAIASESDEQRRARRAASMARTRAKQAKPTPAPKRTVSPPKPERETTKSMRAPELKVTAHRLTALPKVYVPEDPQYCGELRGDGSHCKRLYPCAFHGEAA